MLNLTRRSLQRVSLSAFLLILIGGIFSAQAQTNSSTPALAKSQSNGNAAAASSNDDANALAPVYHDFKGVQIGMSADEVRRKLGRPKESDETQDFFVFSDTQLARVYYDNAHKATAIIVTYIGKSNGAPSPKDILGSDIEAKSDGSMYKMVQYPKAGFWVAYSRVSGDEPMTIITMQKMN
jgi:hypothetical protein